MVDAVPVPAAAKAHAKSALAKSQRMAKHQARDDGFIRELTRQGTAEKDIKEPPTGKTGRDVEKTKPEDGMRAAPQPPSIESLLAQIMTVHCPPDQAMPAAPEDRKAGRQDEPRQPGEEPVKSRLDRISAPRGPAVAVIADEEPEPARPAPVQAAPAPPLPEDHVKLAAPVIAKLDEAAAPPARKSEAAPVRSAGEDVPDLPLPALVSGQAPLPQSEFRPPAEQILDRLLAPAQALATENPAPKPPLKSIQFELRPEALGTVQVTLKLSNGKMEIEIVPRERETESLLKADGALVDQVVRAVTAAGDVSSVTVSIAHRDPEFGNTAGNGSAAQDNASQQAGERSGAQGGSSSSHKDEGANKAHDKAEPVQDTASAHLSLLRPRIV